MYMYPNEGSAHRAVKSVSAARGMAASLADEIVEVQPPENFAMAWRGVYRSGFPTKKNLAFLQQLGLRSSTMLISPWVKKDRDIADI